MLSLLSILFSVAFASDVTFVETRLEHEGAPDRYTVTAGTIDSTEGVLQFQKWFQGKIAEARHSNPEAYVEIRVFEANDRTPQGIIPKLPNLGRKPVQIAKRLSKKINKVAVFPVVRLGQQLSDWVRAPEHRLQVTFAMVAAAVDGMSNSITLALFQNVSIPNALIVGGAVAALSSSWSALTPNIAKFLNGDPSLVDRFISEKSGLLKSGSKWVEGLFKWGLIQAVYLSVVTGVSASVGAMHFASLADWAQSVGSTAALTTVGQGVFDHSLSIEIDRSLKESNDPELQKKTLFRTYLLGTSAASAAALGGLGSVIGMDFGNIILYGLLGAGVVNLARIEKASIKSFVQKVTTACVLALSPKSRTILPQWKTGAASWGSE